MGKSSAFSAILMTVFLVTSGFGQNRKLPVFKLSQEVRKSFSVPDRVAGRNTVSVLVLRVQFEEDNNPATSGTGRFDLRDLRDSLSIDPPPHNKQYFEDHLLALRNYFIAVSDSNLFVDATIKPDASDEAYTLPRFMATYAPLGTDQQRSDSLAAFFRDAVTFADNNDDLDFSDYDFVMIFHAGTGEDFALEEGSINPTPRDLPSRFISLAALRAAFGSDYPGVSVDGGTHFVENGILLPETESQVLPTFFGDQFFEVGLNGIVAANFASQLGIPDLFNTDDGTSAIGVFSLMDQGAFNGDGLIPAEPDAWSKIFMGWAEPRVVTNLDSLAILPRVLAGHNDIVKIPINEREYFLVENRQRDVVDNSLSGAVIQRIDSVFNGNQFSFVDSVYYAGVEIGVSGVITRVDEYDNGLPGRGLLIWHIDENIIGQNIGSNTINADLDHKGVDLEEASGSQDIGIFFVVGPLGSFNTGDAFDFFYRGNQAFEAFNQVVNSTFFSEASIPAALSNSRSSTGISILDISPPGSVMSCSVATTVFQSGFPRFTDSGAGRRDINYGDLDGDGVLEVIVASPGGDVYAYRFDGTHVIENGSTSTVVDLKGDSVVVPVGRLFSAGDSTAGSLAVADLTGDNRDEIVFLSRNRVLVLSLGAGSVLDTLVSIAADAEISTPPLVTESGAILFGDVDGRVYRTGISGVLDLIQSISGTVRSLAMLDDVTVAVVVENGTYLLHLTTGLAEQKEMGMKTSVAVGDLNQDGSPEVVTVGNGDGTIFYEVGLQSGNEPEEFSFSHGDFVGDYFPALADINGDGRLEAIFGGEGRVFAYNLNGVLTTNFFRSLGIDGSAVTSSPVIADLDSDGRQEVIVGAGNGKVYALRADGTSVPGFPLQASAGISGSPALLDLDADDDLELLVVSDDGYLYAWDLQGPYDPEKLVWPRHQHDPRNSSRTLATHVLNNPDVALLPASKAYNYPNPAKKIAETTIRYFLTEPADVRITVYDMAGDLADRFKGPGIGGTDNEVVWDLSKVESGVYFARIEARTADKNAHQIIKIAVIK